MRILIGFGAALILCAAACDEDTTATTSSSTGTSAGGDASGGQSAGGDAGGATSSAAGGAGGDSGGAGGGPPPPSDCDAAPISSTAYWVDVSGDDGTGDGSLGAPWATITHALENVPDGAEIVVRPGEYTGRVRLDEAFATGVVVRAEANYQSRLRNDDIVVSSYGGQGITLSGFDIAHSGAGAGALVIQIANAGTSNITIRNNVLHDSYNNDILKINNGAENVLVERNLFYNQEGSDEHMDINSVRDVTVQDNVFVNDFSASGRDNDNSTSSYIVIKDSNGDSDGISGSEDITVRRNVFANWQGSSGQHFVRIGEDGTANYEAIGVIVENNLMLGTTDNSIRAAFGCYGSSDVLFRNNTVVGDLPGNAFAIRMIAVDANMNNADIRYFNNIWSDPTGTMDDFSDTTPGQTDTWTLANNVYYDGGNMPPEDAGELVNPSDDAAAIIGDPALGDPASAIIPTWNPGTMLFTDGSATTCAAHERLVTLHGTPGTGSVALDAGDAGETPADDILGRPRGPSPDVGAVEVP